MHALEEVLSMNKTINEIDLSSNKLKSDTGSVISNILMRNPGTLRKLNLNNNSLADEGFY